MINYVSFFMAGVLSFSVLAGCSSTKPIKEETVGTVPINTAPVTVQLAASNIMFPEEDFNRYITEPVKKKYPHITVERINLSEKGKTLADLITAGTIPDIVTVYPGNLG